MTANYETKYHKSENGTEKVNSSSIVQILLLKFDTSII
jgi:hypothetical protein